MSCLREGERRRREESDSRIDASQLSMNQFNSLQKEVIGFMDDPDLIYGVINFDSSRRTLALGVCPDYNTSVIDFLNRCRMVQIDYFGGQN